MLIHFWPRGSDAAPQDSPVARFLAKLRTTDAKLSAIVTDRLNYARRPDIALSDCERQRWATRMGDTDYLYEFKLPEQRSEGGREDLFLLRSAFEESHLATSRRAQGRDEEKRTSGGGRISET